MTELTRYRVLPPRERPISTRLSFVAGYFQLSALLGGASLLVGAGAVVAGQEAARTALAAHPFLWLTAAVVAAGWWRTGTLLRRRSRAGLWFALGTFALPVVSWAAGAGSTVAALVTAGVGSMIALSTWRELR